MFATHMKEFVTAVSAIAFLLAFLGCIPYTGWIIYNAFKRRWRRVGVLVAVPAVVSIGLWSMDSVIEAKEYPKYLSNLYDTDVALGQALYQYDSPRAFNGDGYSLSVYELPAKVRARFQSADKRLLSEFPKRPDYRDHWTPRPWREAPFDPSLKKYLDFALGEYDSERASGLSSQFQAIREALSRKGVYYAFFAYDHGNYPGNIDLFIVDLKGGRLYSINHNT